MMKPFISLFVNCRERGWIIMKMKLFLLFISSLLLLSACSLNQINEIEKFTYEENVDGLQFKVDIEVGDTFIVSGLIYNTEDQVVHYELGSRNCLTPTTVTITSETGEELVQEVSSRDYPCRDEFVVSNLEKVKIIDDNSHLLKKYIDMVPIDSSIFSLKNSDKLPSGKYTVLVTLNLFPDEKLSINYPVHVQN